MTKLKTIWKNSIQKIKKIAKKIIQKIKKIQQPFIDWVHGLPFALKITIGVFCGMLGIIGLTNPFIPAWFFLPASGQILFSKKAKRVK